MAESRNIKFRESQATIIMCERFPLICNRAMYASNASCSLMSYRDLQASESHDSTALENNEEALELRQGQRFFATAHARDDGLYKIVIKPITISHISKTKVKEVCLAIWARTLKLKAAPWRRMYMLIQLPSLICGTEDWDIQLRQSFTGYYPL